MIKLINILKEVKVQPFSALSIFPTEKGIALLANNKYLYYDSIGYDTYTKLNNTKYTLIGCNIEIDIDETKTSYILNIGLSEPSYGGGAPSDEEVEEAYDEFEEQISISQLVLVPYCEEYNNEYYSIPFKNISNTKVINKEYLL
jgi:hypothetical protein